MTDVTVTVGALPGWTILHEGERTCWFTGYLLDPVARGEAATPHALATVADAGGSAEDVARAVGSLTGHFALIVQVPGRTIAAVDRVRSTPVFFAERDGVVHVDASAVRLRDHLGLGVDDIDPGAALAVAMSGYTVGTRTLYTGLAQLRAGEVLVVADGEPPHTERYYTYRAWRGQDRPQDTLVEELTAVTRGLFDDLANLAGDRTILVPLSGGLDSRLVVSGLREVGFDRIQTFAYGLPGNFEAAISERVADRLGVPWFFVPVTHRMMRRAVTDPVHEAYLAWADTCASVPVEHEFLAVAELRRRGWSGHDAIIVNGQSGDFVTGGHVPAALLDPTRASSDTERRSAIVDALIDKHYSLWERLRTDANLDLLRTMLWDDITTVAGLPDDPARDYGLYEASEWQNRQSRYIVTNQRIYEFFGFEWALPLWEASYLDFWETVPPHEKFGQALYRRMLERTDWGGVWRSIPGRQYVSPRWLRASRPLLKAAVGAVSGRNGWAAFQRRYLDYWMDVQGKTAVVPYRRVVTDQRGARHAVSWLTESYLARHGLDWRGRPMSRP